MFKPSGIPGGRLARVELGLDELEAVRLADLEGLYHDQAAKDMGVSRATFGRVIAAARHKVADALVNGKMLVIQGGVVTMANRRVFECEDCGHRFEAAFGTGRPIDCPSCRGNRLCRAGDGRGSQGRGGAAGEGRCRRLRRRRCGSRARPAGAEEAAHAGAPDEENTA